MEDNYLSNTNSFQSRKIGEHNLPIFSVSEISLSIKQAVEGNFQRVRVQGEISNFKQAASGHMYFAMIDKDSVLDGVCWRSTANKLLMSPEDGMEVLATGRITTYANRSKYQMIIDRMELAGEGALLKLLEDRRKRLAAEGLFNIKSKKKLPYLPNVIGVITSPTGAVIRDILHQIEDRFPRHIVLWPVPVQGQKASEKISTAIQGFNSMPVEGHIPRPDVLIVARGGGSLEDLWPFNEENVIRATAESAIPIISAIGHETDTTLIDHASDCRAPTPTAAAEMVVPIRLELIANISDIEYRLANLIMRMIQIRVTTLKGLARGLPNLLRVTDESSQRLDDWDERLCNSLLVGLKQRESELKEITAALRNPEPIIASASQRLENEVRAIVSEMRNILHKKSTTLTTYNSLLESYSYRRTLERGFARVTDHNNKTVRSASKLPPGSNMEIDFCNGTVAAIAVAKQTSKSHKQVLKPYKKK